MKEYLEKSVVLDNVLNQMQCSKSLLAMQERIQNLESADVVEQKHGKWLDVTTLDNEFICWVCSECRHGADFVDEPYNFCPNCGADMRGDNDV